MASRHQVDLSIKKPIYDDAKARMTALQKSERLQHGVKISSLADIGRNAIMAYRKGDGANYAPRIARSAADQIPKREPFRFDVAADLYKKQRRRITMNGHYVTQVVEEALKHFTATGEIPVVPDDELTPDE